MTRLVLFTLLIAFCANPAFADQIAICGESEGYAFYPKAGLGALAKGTGKWVDDKITGGRVTFTQISKDEYDILYSDSTGRIISARQDGGVVVVTGAANDAISVIVSYPATTVMETYTFLRNENGAAEVMWTSNKGGGALMMKAGAYRADCTFLAK